MAFESIIVNGRIVQTHRPELLGKVKNDIFTLTDNAMTQYEPTGERCVHISQALDVLVNNQSPGLGIDNAARSPERYLEAIGIACSRHKRIRKTCLVNQIFTQLGNIRKQIGWINGTNMHNALVVTVLPKYVPELLKDLEQFSLDQNLNPTIRALILFGQLLLIHPFKDGNGRTARVLLYTDLLRCGWEAESAAKMAVYSISKVSG